MLIKVAAILAEHPGLTVSFLTDLGGAVGIWQGESPTVGATCHVELEADGIFTFGERAIQSDADHPSIAFANGMIRITGILESLEDDGFAVIRLADSLMTFMSAGLDSLIGRFIQIEADHIDLHPYEI